jgi:hypothetical protein
VTGLVHSLTGSHEANKPLFLLNYSVWNIQLEQQKADQDGNPSSSFLHHDQDVTPSVPAVGRQQSMDGDTYSLRPQPRRPPHSARGLRTRTKPYNHILPPGRLGDVTSLSCVNHPFCLTMSPLSGQNQNMSYLSPPVGGGLGMAHFMISSWNQGLPRAPVPSSSFDATTTSVASPPVNSLQTPGRLDALPSRH